MFKDGDGVVTALYSISILTLYVRQLPLVGTKFLSEFPPPPESRLEAASFHQLGSPESRLEATPTLIYRNFSLVGTMETRFDRRIRFGLLDFIRQGFGLINIHDV
jgi:hypothetical protein